MSERDQDTPFTFVELPPEDEEPPPPRRRRTGRSATRWLVLLACVVGVAAALWYLRPAPLMKLLRDTPLQPAPVITRAYKWRDADGGWQITDTPPAEGTSYEVIEVSSDTNVLPLPPALQRE